MTTGTLLQLLPCACKNLGALRLLNAHRPLAFPFIGAAAGQRGWVSLGGAVLFSCLMGAWQARR